MTKFADKHCDKLHDKICRQSLSTAADEYLTFWFLCIFFSFCPHTKTSRAYIQLTVEGFPFCRSACLRAEVPACVPASVCIARTHECMHPTGVGRSAGKPSGTQALVQESARAGAHTETGTSTTLDACTCIDRVLNIIDILSNITIPNRGRPG